MTTVSILANGQCIRTSNDWGKKKPFVHEIRLVEERCGGANEVDNILALPIYYQKHLGRMKEQSYR